ncbi:MAG: alkyl hydroperoxide reductase [Flavobacteriales bacterium CG_4_10_14_0_2_um_filter_32_8]|nr:MAG: alkyl hydroperoxide reductase [Flavobacteriales bacterium CG_4_10_14_0_2_um_filter_32_8]PJB15307.1 MAG: alkyl hydroperoxide reductase [Flavobacteriales bacterium CG_4_9_14_3_um_filter_32_8]
MLLSILSLSLSCKAQDKSLKTVNDAKGSEVGQVVENFTATDVNNNPVSLEKTLEKGPVVLIFIRGQWCPICNRHMNTIQDSLKYIQDKGAQVVVISPEKPEFIEKTIEKSKAEFIVLYDEGQKISDYFDVTFNPDGKTKAIYNTVLGAKLKESHTDDSERLPIPATFIIDKNKKIIWRQFDPDYKNRSTVKDIIINLPK